MLLRLRKLSESRPPAAVGAVEVDSRFIERIDYEFVAKPSGNVKIWKHHFSGGEYVMGQDVGEGAGQPYCVGYVLRCPDPPSLKTENPCNEYRVVAEMRDNTTSPELFTIHAWCRGSGGITIGSISGCNIETRFHLNLPLQN